jgi:hypothetical protein
MVLGAAFLVWCVYMGVIVPSQYGAYGNEVERSHANDEEEDDSVGEDDVGEDSDRWS